MNFFSALGVDLKMLAAQVVNFSVLLFILYKIAYHPLLAFIDERKKKIDKGLEDAILAKQAYKDARDEQTTILTHARQEAKRIIDAANEYTQTTREAMLQKTKTEMEKIVAQSKKQLAEERQKMLMEIKDDVADIVVTSTQKILEKEVTAALDKQWLEKQFNARLKESKQA